MALQKKYFNIKIPFNRDPNAQYFEMNKNEIDAAADDLKLLLLTGQNERVMHPEYGIGLDQFVFDPDIDKIKVEIQSRINKQIKLLKNIQVNDILVQSYFDLEPSKQVGINENTIIISIYWVLRNVDMEEKTTELKIEI